jgi:hypothetical protein
MKRLILLLLAAVVLFGTAYSSFAQRHRDPLSSEEADQLRELRQEPMKRLRLMVKFARIRLETAERLRSDSRLPDNGKQMRMALEDFTNLVDEMDDNVDLFKSDDIRKPLKEIIEADSDFQLRLRTLKEATPEAQRADYDFALTTAIDSVNASADTARAMLDDQVATRGKVKAEDIKAQEKADKEEEKQKKRDEKKGKDSKQIACPVQPC